MKKLLLLPILFFAHIASTTAQISPALQARLTFVLDSVCAEYNIKGASAAVLIPQQGTWKGAYGESYVGAAINSNMLFGIGSNTKTFTSALMLKLQENGLLDLDDTIGTWIQTANVSGQITIRQLLNHTSGLYSFTNHPNYSSSVNADVEAIWQPEQVLQFVNAPLFAPGADWSYSNTNYLIAGLIAKYILGADLHDILRDSILTPAGLSNTLFYPFETPPVGSVPHAWSQYFGPPFLVDGISVGWEHQANFSMAGAAGAIMSTAEDNVKFWDKLMTGNIINSTSLDEMKQTVSLGGGVGYGLGVFRRSVFNGHVVYNHGGTNVCWINENVYDDENGVCVSVLTNQDSVSNHILLSEVVAALHRETLEALSVPVTGINSQIKVYPNPAHNDINIVTEEPLTMQLSDISGKKILSAEFKKGNNNIPLIGTSPGLYFIQLMNSNGQLVHARKVSVY